MLYRNIDLVGAFDLSSLPRISIDEIVDINHMDLIPIRKRELSEEYIVPLENSYKFITENNVSFEEFLEVLSESHMIDVDSLVFSIKPITIYTNEDVKCLAASLKEAGYPVYLHNDPFSYESQVLDYICNECLETNSTKPLDQLITYTLNEDFSDTAAATGIDGLNSFFDTMRHAAVNAFKGHIDDKIGKYIDSTETGKVLDPQKGIVDSTITHRNTKIMDKVMNSPIFKNRFWDFSDKSQNKDAWSIIGTGVEDIRRQAVNFLGDAPQKLLGLDPSKPFTPSQLISAIGAKLSNLKNRLTGSPPQQQGLISALINKLVALKNKLVQMISGNGKG